MTLALQRPPAGKIKTDESGRLYMVSDPTPDTPNIHLWDTGGKYKVEGVNMVWQNAGTDKAWVDADGNLYCKSINYI
jgi:hypothetical protein